MPVESVTFVYNGSDTVVATVANSQLGTDYTLICHDPASSASTDSGNGGDLVLTVNTIGGISDGDTFYVQVQEFPDGFPTYGATIFELGREDEFAFNASWSFDGTDTVSATFRAPIISDTYIVEINDSGGGGSNSDTGTGAPQIITAVAASPCVDDYFYVLLYDPDTPQFRPLSVRLFAAGLPGEGFAGNPTAAEPFGIAIAFDDDTMAPTPTWTRLDQPVTDVPWRVNGFTISRGRQAEFDKTGTGQATVTLSDPTGAFDPTNASGPFAGLLDPMKQAAIKIQNPVTEDWRYLFRGFVAEWPGDLNQTSRMETVELELVDGFALLERTAMYPGTTEPPAFGTTVPVGTEGDIYFAQTSGTAQVRGRINQVLDQADWGLETHIFSGNIDLQPTIYSRGESVLTVLLDCADAEFPGVSQILCSRRGGVVFRGRYARFDPTSYIATDDDDLRSGPAGTGGRLWSWECGGRPECDAGTALALISDIGWRRSANDIINAALAVPYGATDEESVAQLYKDDTSIAQFGWRSGPEMENLIVFEGNTPPGQTNLEETRFYAEYYVENYKAPQTRITTLTFRGLPLQDPAASPTWALICGVEIGDPIHVTTSHFGTAGGFDDDYLIEGIRYQAEPAHNSMWDITLELDVSPQSFYAHNPWGTAIPADDQDTPAE